MMRVPQPLQRREQRAIAQMLLRTPGDFAHE
jgi:hypothetical protein